MYVFIGEGSNFPSGIFTTLENAKEWIDKYSLNGILNKYPIDMGVYDWAIKEDFFTIKNEYQKESKFIQRFICASMEHFHFEDGSLK
ncbi:DUF7710 domain-containing protein [Chryseobacterium fistulae]|uniref:DUF7710 domain-containing protein n=1 Tax=Chryseobacterium fistulae TaxID=2675058 RepID=A0A6N4XS05_9FLAO|nr:hypothetical protein [Chryseobacterium fistulae]CAA7391639.1 hypothetical protein CHRY9393_02946 [Chryseobacterium fistulae]